MAAVARHLDEPWTPEPSRGSWVLDMPADVMARLRVRAMEAGCVREDGQPDLSGLLERKWLKLGNGVITSRVLDVVRLNDADPDMQALQAASVRAAMERDRPN